jgi:3',5'-cyclic AMP phosphodiesterase CpdA
MQNKYLLIADAHIHHEPQWRFDWLAKELAQLYDEYAHTHQLMLLGDVFEVRDRIDARAANLFLDTVIEWQKKNRVIWITGQHDSYVPGRATFEGLRGLRDGVRGVLVADKPLWYTVEPGVVAVPYCRDMAQYRALLKSAHAVHAHAGQRGGAKRAR